MTTRTDRSIRSALLKCRSLLASLAVLFLMGSSCEGNPVFVEDPLEGPDPGETAVLFIGNSITIWFDMVEQFEALADSAGRGTWIIDLSKLGQRLENHLEFAVTEVKIAEYDWDYVVLQESNFAVAFPDSHHLMVPEFSHFRDLILADNADCNIVMYMDYAMEGVTLLDTFFTFNANFIIFAWAHFDESHAVV